MGGGFTASVRSLVQPGRVSSKYFGKRNSWPSHLQADLVAACWRDTNLGTGGGQQPCMTNSLSAFSSMLLFLENFHGCFGTSSGMARPSLVKLPIKESVVKGTSQC